MCCCVNGSDRDGDSRGADTDVDVKSGGDTPVDGDDSDCGDGALLLTVVAMGLM